MKNSFGLLLSDVKKFLCNETNRIFFAVIIVGVLLLYCQHRTELQIEKIYNYNVDTKKELISEIHTNRSKIHFRYFNLTRSLEEIFAVKIDTKDGKLEK